MVSAAHFELVQMSDRLLSRDTHKALDSAAQCETERECLTLVLDAAYLQGRNDEED